MYNFSKKQKIIIGIILTIASVILLNYIYNKENNQTQEQISTYEEEQQSEKLEEKTKEEIVIHIAGAVNTEGVLFLQEGDRISTAIEKAGGIKENADISQINLAYQLEDGMKIYIPTKEEMIEMEKEEQEITTNTNTEQYINNQNQEISKKESKTTKKVNINSATQTELETLPGIGTSTANKIIKHRTENGKFKTIEDIKNVSGIGEAKFNNIKDLISV